MYLVSGDRPWLSHARVRFSTLSLLSPFAWRDRTLSLCQLRDECSLSTFGHSDDRIGLWSSFDIRDLWAGNSIGYKGGSQTLFDGLIREQKVLPGIHPIPSCLHDFSSQSLEIFPNTIPQDKCARQVWHASHKRFFCSCVWHFRQHSLHHTSVLFGKSSHFQH